MPGPGEYNPIKGVVGRPKVMSTGAEANKKPRIIEHLININKYQSIPSIPSNIHAYGYNENDSTFVLMQTMSSNSTSLQFRCTRERKQIQSVPVTTTLRQRTEPEGLHTGPRPRKRDSMRPNPI